MEKKNKFIKYTNDQSDDGVLNDDDSDGNDDIIDNTNNYDRDNELLKQQINKLNELYGQQNERLIKVCTDLKYNKMCEGIYREKFQSLELESQQLKVEIAKKQLAIKKLYIQFENIEQTKQPSIEQSLQFEKKIKLELTLLNNDISNYNSQYQHIELTKQSIKELTTGLFIINNCNDNNDNNEVVDNMAEFDDGYDVQMSIDDFDDSNTNKNNGNNSNNNNNNNVNLDKVIEETETIKNYCKEIKCKIDEFETLIAKDTKLQFDKVQTKKKKLEDELFLLQQQSTIESTYQ